MRQLPDHHFHRPAVADDVVHHHHQHLLVFGQADQLRPQQRPLRQVEPCRRVAAHDLVQPRLPLALLTPAQVDALQWQLGSRGDLLPRLAIPGRESCPQHLVAAHDLVETPL